MESLSRPPHRRNHSTTRTASSSPYDDVLLSKGGKAKFEAREYAEIFSGSSSIPVLDLSGLNDRVGSDDCRGSRLDYSNIFGEFRDDDVAVPYEQLFNGSLKKTKTRIPADMESKESGSVDSSSSQKTKSASCVESDQSVDGVKQHFNLSFNKTSQRNSDESNGKTHIAQLHAVPGFTHFVDGTPPLQKESGDRPVPSMKREVSRAWSFSTGIDVTSSHSSIPNDYKNLRQSRLPSFASQDASRKTVGECSPPLFDEELDENSVAAVTVAALKKAIEQAQESIRIAKVIMGKKKEGLKDGSKHRSKNRSEVKDKKETRIQLDALKENNIRETCEILDPTSPMSNGVYGKSVPDLSYNDSFLNVDEAKVDMVRENVEAAIDVCEKFPPSCSQSEILNADENVGMENGGQNVEAAEAPEETAKFTGVADEKCRTVTFESGKVDSSDNSTCSTDDVRPCIEQMETGEKTLKPRELTIHQSERPEVISVMAESGPSTSQSVQELEKSADEAFEQCQVIVNQIEGPKNISEIMLKPEKIMNEGGANLRISQVDELTEESDGVADDKECEKKFVGNEELVGIEQLTVLKLESDSLVNESRILVEKNVMEQADMFKKSENVSGWKENNQDGKSSDEEENGMVLEEEHQWFESELQLTDPAEEETSQMELEIFPEVGINNVNVVHEPEIVDNKLNCERDEDEQILPEKHGLNEIGDRRMDSSECAAAETMQTETNNYSEVADIDEAIDAHCNDSGTMFNETQEPCNVDLNRKAEEYQADARCCKENDRLPLENEIFSAIEDNEAGEPIHLEINEMPETDSLHRYLSKEEFIESQPDSTFEGLSSGSKSDNVDLINADHEETLQTDEEMFTTACDIRNGAQEFHTANNKGTEFDDTFVKPVLERNSESNEESLFTSILENIVEVSTIESPEYEENLRGSTSNEEAGKDHLVMTCDEREHVGERSETLHTNYRNGDMFSQLNCEPKEVDKSMDAEREVETVQSIEKNKENLSRASKMGQKDTKGSDREFGANDQQQRIESIKRGREREKDRIVVERAIREARERAFAEARERAAVERAAAESRKRVMENTFEKVEKTFVENKQPADKVSNEARLRAERAAVERATTEARERALEKAMSQKTYTEARTQADKHSTERLSSSSRNNGLKHSFSSSDLKKVDGAFSESAQRRKARLERHQRIMERAAKALAEKNMRDVLAQKEQAERNRLAESLDADVKRWATGKQGNLRALLSTLQYILGPDSGWQPVSLTEIITTAAVKKAYRKATLCVHPDKLQQRGATIHQKYICEKVFDLLKAAWNRFNSEER